jgi:predicted lipid-binding transport protein (Tim44 family)
LRNSAVNVQGLLTGSSPDMGEITKRPIRVTPVFGIFMRRPCLLLLALLALPAASHMPVASSVGIVSGLSIDGFLQGIIGTKTALSYESGLAAYTGPFYPTPIYSSGYGRAYGMRPGSAFTSGLLGGFWGAGLGGLLFGGGFFSAMHGGPGVLGLLLQIMVAYTLSLWLYRQFAATCAPAGAALYARLLYASSLGQSGVARPGTFGGGRRGRPIVLSPADFHSFEELLHCMQTAWSAQDLNALRTMTTPDMAEAYAWQLNEQRLRGVRNAVSDVRLLQGDVCEAWSDGKCDQAIVSMNFSMLDVTFDSAGRVVEGNQTQRVTVRQYWSFERMPRARWVVSGIAASPK